MTNGRFSRRKWRCFKARDQPAGAAAPARLVSRTRAMPANFLHTHPPHTQVRRNWLYNPRFSSFGKKNSSEDLPELNFHEKTKFHFHRVFRWILRFFCGMLMNFAGNSEKCSENDKMSRDYDKKCQIFSDNAKNFRNLWAISCFISFVQSPP